MDAPRPPAHAGQQAHVTGTGLQARPAPRPPGALRALADAHRHDQQRDPGVGPVRGGDREDVQPEAELEVVHVHGRAAPLTATRRRGQPDGRVQVVPGDAAIDADDAAHPAARCGHAGGLQHPLVVGQLQQVVAALAGGRAWIRLRCLPDQAVQRRTHRGQPAGTGVQAAVMLDIHRPVTGASGRGDQEVRLPHPAPRRIGGQPAANDHRRPRPHRRKRRRLPLGPVRAGDHVRARVQRHQPRDHLALELAAAREPSLHQPRDRQRVARPDDVPLSAHRALLGHVPALRRHGRHVVPVDHVPMLRTA